MVSQYDTDLTSARAARINEYGAEVADLLLEVLDRAKNAVLRRLDKSANKP